jgi:hypothetical protein
LHKARITELQASKYKIALIILLRLLEYGISCATNCASPIRFNFLRREAKYQITSKSITGIAANA